MGRSTQQLITIQGVPKEHKEFLRVIPKLTTQVGCVPLVSLKEKCSQTEHKECKECYYQEHLILQRQNYIIKDAILNTTPGYTEATTSREDSHRMKIPNKSAHDKWIAKFKAELTPRSPGELIRSKPSLTFNKYELHITSRSQPFTNSRIRKPTALTVDNSIHMRPFVLGRKLGLH